MCIGLQPKHLWLEVLHNPLGWTLNNFISFIDQRLFYYKSETDLFVMQTNVKDNIDYIGSE